MRAGLRAANIRAVTAALAQIPMPEWQRVARQNPEWRRFRGLYPRLRYGPLATGMMMAGLNAYQLKGDPDTGYWTELPALLRRLPLPRSPHALHGRLRGYFAAQRLPVGKLRRLSRFLGSECAARIWAASPREVRERIPAIWHELAQTMQQRPRAKTVCFAMKCLGVSVRIAACPLAQIEIPIPVDARILRLTLRLRLCTRTSERVVQEAWRRVLFLLQHRLARLTMIELDSLLWQIGALPPHRTLAFFQRLQSEPTGRAFVALLHEQDTGRR